MEVPFSYSFTVSKLPDRGLDIYLGDIFILAIFVCVLIAVCFEGVWFLKNVPGIIYSFFLLASLFSTIVGLIITTESWTKSAESILFWIRHFEYFIVFTAIVYSLSVSPQKLQYIIKTSMLSCLLAVLWIYYQGISGNYGYVNNLGLGRATLIFDNGPNPAGSYVSLFIPLFLALYFEIKSEIKSYIYLIMVPISIGAIFLTGSRASLGGAVIGSMLTLMLLLPALNVRRALLSVFALAVPLLLVFSIGLLQLQRFYAFFERGLQNLGGRYDDWILSLRTFSENPIFGSGMSLSGQTWTENYYLRLLSEQGLIGATFFLLFVGSTSYYALRLARNSDPYSSIGYGYAGLLAVMLSSSFYSSKIIVFQPAICFWVFTALMVHLSLSSAFYSKHKAHLN